MRKCLNIISLILIFCIPWNYSFSQEALTGLQVNSILEKAYKNAVSLKSSKSTDTLELPFFDDFSYHSVYPNSSKWSDNYAFINSSYPVNPISFQVATLDILNEKGELYPHASTQVFEADKLTSLPINLEYPASENIFLSFFYQAQGLGDPPGERDSLTLEFYSPVEQDWFWIWSVTGESLQPFQQVLIPVTEANFLKKGFKFRFKNYGSLPNNPSVPGTIGNSDHWHIDYVYLDRDRSESDTLIKDVAFVRPIGSLLNNYESVPWDHFQLGKLTEMGAILPMYYKNNDNIVRNVSRSFIIKNLLDNDVVRSFSGGAENLNPWQLREYLPDIAYTYAAPTTDSAIFEVKAFLTTDAFDFKANDTVSYIQKFSNYYAYDDGTAENGYGLTGQGTENARLAYRFQSFKIDTLRAVKFFFNRTLNDASRKYFLLTVWNEISGAPGEIIYQQENIRPEYEEGLNTFYTYHLENPVEVPLVFYVGWVQQTTDFLNVGFDVNRNNRSRIFYNIDGNWRNTSFNGSLMIRPVISSTALPTGIHNPTLFSLGVYPNPTTGIVYLEIPESENTDELFVYVFDVHGRLVINSRLINSQLDLFRLPGGIYFLRLSGRNSLSQTHKIILAR